MVGGDFTTIIESRFLSLNIFINFLRLTVYNVQSMTLLASLAPIHWFYVLNIHLLLGWRSRGLSKAERHRKDHDSSLMKYLAMALSFRRINLEFKPRPLNIEKRPLFFPSEFMNEIKLLTIVPMIT